MAVRSGAGTGVVVSLVVFILTTFFLLILTIVFYSRQTKAVEAQAEAEKTLATYVRPAERNNETFKQYEDSARGADRSVANYLQGRLQSAMEYVDGAPNTSLEELKINMQRAGVEPDEVVKHELQDLRRAVQDRESEIDRLTTQLATWQEENAELEARVENLKTSHTRSLDEVQAQITQYRDAAEEYRREVDEVKSDMRTRVDRLELESEQTRERLQNEIDRLSEERIVLIDRIDEMESKIRQSPLRSPDPSRMVDGTVIDAGGREDRVFIDRGRQHRIVLGMTFEVYDDASALRQYDPESGQLPRGKASMEVIKVGENTSTCKIVRDVPGRPVVRGDVIANAVYDPYYQFKFLVHGKYDVDGDGRPTEAEAEYLRSLVVDWGGQIITGDDLPGDLDFLVLGVAPPRPLDLPDDAPPHLIERWVRQRQAFETYHRLQRQAMDAQIPVLNHNRFFILTGYTVR